MSGRAGGEAQDLVDPLHYLRSALEPFAEVIEAPLAEMLNAAPDVLVLADVGSLGEAERDALVPWVEKGGLLVRFAGPRLAQSGAGQLEEDPLLPVRLRAGGRVDRRGDVLGRAAAAAAVPGGEPVRRARRCRGTSTSRAR